jgi:hypothetical protein
MVEFNPFLKLIMRQVYQNRCPLPIEPKTVVRHEIADGKPMCEVWFMSEGCTYDRDGGCTMCNYGKGHAVDSNFIIEELKFAFNELPKAAYNLVINPSGSFLDEREVSGTLRNSIYDLLDDIPFESLTIESRADVITPPLLAELKNRYPNRRVSIEIGVETLDPWLLKNSINKGVMVEQIENAVRMIRGAGLISIANIGLGIPFICEKTNIIQAIKSATTALNKGFDLIILFPYHIKPGTLLEVLFTADRYHRISLWSLVEVLANLPSKYLPQINISWYRNYYTDKRKVIESPDTCPHCRNIVLGLLDQYKAAPCQSTLSALLSFQCNCQDEWRIMIDSQSDSIKFSAVEDDYRYLANHFKINNDLLAQTLTEMKEGLYVGY